ncbi:hypothetical protein H105_05866 [Trichophyton soudanense CBS 452.61]|uniref:Uncharacterized protein n=1 Tax=Trichophyton soudanense CBS 452.61 TaxID=1215331 RepID=A0A022XNV5_TRISD|nr:hypothetical protein H105_05866 [Trichophyton soudanense CBS 452.61]
MTVTPGIHRIGGQELAFFVHNKLGREMLALPERDVRYAPGSMGLHQIHLHRPSYINGLLIQSRGRREMRACTACQGSTGLRPFTECARLPGHFGGEGIFHFMIKLKKKPLRQASIRQVADISTPNPRFRQATTPVNNPFKQLIPGCRIRYDQDRGKSAAKIGKDRVLIRKKWDTQLLWRK